jgi:hypothetical protein
MTPEARTSLLRLAGLLSARNLLDAQIAGVIQRPALAGHIGEFIASLVFGIQLATSAAQAGHDGRFSDGPLAGNTMNVKCYATREGLLDINDRNLPDYYLVLAGPKSDAMTSTAGARPFMVEEVFLFNAESLVAAQRARGVAVGVASSVPTRAWEAVRIFPAGAQTPLQLSQEQIDLLELFRDLIRT